jgi:hypothetical protein
MPATGKVVIGPPRLKTIWLTVPPLTITDSVRPEPLVYVNGEPVGVTVTVLLVANVIALVFALKRFLVLVLLDG